MDITIGMMDKRVTLRVPSVSTNESYGQYTSYTDGQKVWAYVRKKRTYRNLEANIDGMEDTNEFFVKKSIVTDPITKDWMLQYRGQDYSINAIELVKEQTFMYRIEATGRYNLETNSSSS